MTMDTQALVGELAAAFPGAKTRPSRDMAGIDVPAADLPAVRALLAHPDPMVSEHAAWAEARIAGRSARRGA